MSWAIAIAALFASLWVYERYVRRLPDFPELFAPVSVEERRAREELKDTESKLDELRIRHKHERQDWDRERARLGLEVWSLRRKVRQARSVLDGVEEPGPEPEMETVGRAG